MGRYLYNTYDMSKNPRFVVVWSMHWAVIEVQRFKPLSDLSAAMTATLERLDNDGWKAECDPVFGFTFIMKCSERRLLMITPRDPYDRSAQSFNPHRRIGE